MKVLGTAVFSLPLIDRAEHSRASSNAEPGAWTHWDRTIIFIMSLTPSYLANDTTT
jgi:hypothetical protein